MSECKSCGTDIEAGNVLCPECAASAGSAPVGAKPSLVVEPTGETKRCATCNRLYAADYDGCPHCAQITQSQQTSEAWFRLAWSIPLALFGIWWFINIWSN